MATELTIGKLTDAAGVNIETIRYYQRRGLLDEPPKPPGGHRRYAPEQTKRLRFIKRAQALGFTLDEVGALLTLDAACACGETRALAVRKLGLSQRPQLGDGSGRAVEHGLSGTCGACVAWKQPCRRRRTVAVSLAAGLGAHQSDW